MDFREPQSKHCKRARGRWIWSYLNYATGTDKLTWVPFTITEFPNDFEYFQRRDAGNILFFESCICHVVLNTCTYQILPISVERLHFWGKSKLLRIPYMNKESIDKDQFPFSIGQQPPANSNLHMWQEYSHKFEQFQFSDRDLFLCKLLICGCGHTKATARIQPLQGWQHTPRGQTWTPLQHTQNMHSSMATGHAFWVL